MSIADVLASRHSWWVECCDVLDGLAGLPDGSVHCVCCSPPYWSLRDYGVAGQIGLEPTPGAWVEKMVAVFAEVRRVLRKDGTLWLNIGDAYAGSWGAQSRPNGKDEGSTLQGGSPLHARQIAAHPKTTQTGGSKRTPGLKPKDLIGLPWRVAFALQADGWWLRSDIVWSKPNPMPESVTDRPTRSHEYVFLLTKAARYYYDADAVREPQDTAGERHEGTSGYREGHPSKGGIAVRALHPLGRNRRTVWTIPTEPFNGWGETVRQVHVPLDEVDGDTKRTPSPGCPVHGDRPGPVPTLRGGGRAGGDPSRNGHSDGRPAQAPLFGSSPIAPTGGEGSAGGSSDSPHLARSAAAIGRSSGTHRTDPDPSTTQPYTPSAGMPDRTDDTPTQPGSVGPRGSTHGSSSGSASRTSETPARTARTSFQPVPSEACTCTYYKEVAESISHFATFPTPLVEPCILAGCPPKVCPACGAPWARVTERTPMVVREGPGRAAARLAAGEASGSRTAVTATMLAPPTSTTIGWEPTCTHGVEPIGGIVLDCFSGSGTTGLVALRLGRRYLGIELSAAYVALSEKRITGDAPLLNTPSTEPDPAARRLGQDVLPLFAEAGT